MPDDYNMTSAQLDSLIQKMIDAHEPEEAIASVVKAYSPKKEISPFKPIIPSEPSDWWGGFRKSITSGDALQHGLEAGNEYGRAALLNIPGALWGTAKTVAGLMSMGDPQKQFDTGKELFEGIKALPGNIWEAGKKSGSDEGGKEFGNIMGQTFGMPALMELGALGIPEIPAAVRTTKRVVGAPIRAASGPIEKLGTTALAASPYAPYGWKLKTAGAGYGLRKIGQVMKDVGIPAEEANAAASREFFGGPKSASPSSSELVINTNSDPFSRTPLNEPGISDTDALRQFYGGDRPASVPSSDININTDTDPFSRAPLPRTMFSGAEVPEETGVAPEPPPVIEPPVIEPESPPVGDMSGYGQPELPLDYGPQQETLIPHPIDEFDRLSNLGVRTPGQITELDALRDNLGVNRTPTPLRSGVNPFTGKFRKVPGEPVQGNLDLTAPANAQGQGLMYDLGYSEPPPELPSPAPAPEPPPAAPPHPLAKRIQQFQSKYNVSVEKATEMAEKEAKAINNLTSKVKGFVKDESGTFDPKEMARNAKNLFKGSKGEGLGKKSFEGQWRQAIQEAEAVGIDWQKYDNLDELQWHTTQKAAQETIRTGKNPLTSFVKNDQGAIDVNDELTVRLAKKVAQKIREKFGREASPEELETGVELLREESGPKTGESTGRVADFHLQGPKYSNLYEISEVLKGKLREEGVVGNEGEIADLMAQAEKYIDNYKTSSQARTDHVEMTNLVDKARNESEAELFQSIADSIKEKGNQLNAAETEGMGQIRPMNELRNRFIPDETITQGELPDTPDIPLPEIPPELQYGVRRVLPTDQSAPLDMGQQDLSLGPHTEFSPRELKTDMWPRPENDIAALRAKQILGEDWGRPGPEQLSMEGQMKDHEISAYLKGENPTPPEMQDLTKYAPAKKESVPKNLKNTTSQNWAARLEELDARNAPDHAYRDIMSTAGKNPLKRGQTWRQRVLDGIKYFESR